MKMLMLKMRAAVLVMTRVTVVMVKIVTDSYRRAGVGDGSNDSLDDGGDDVDDGDDGDKDDDKDDNDSKADEYGGGDGDDESFQAQQQRTCRSSAS